MPDAKISELPLATTPLVGNEPIPLVQGGLTVQATVRDLGIVNNATATESYAAASGFQGILFVYNTSGAGVTVTLPADPDAGQWVRVKDVAGNADNYPITVAGVGVTIDGNDTYLINTNYQATMFIWNGAEWSIL